MPRRAQWQGGEPGFVVEAATRAGSICEAFATYEEALHRIEQLAFEGLIGLPLLFKQLADGSQRLVRDDGKPLQWHRLPEDPLPAPDEPIPLTDKVLDLPPPVELTTPPDWPELIDPADFDNAP